MSLPAENPFAAPSGLPYALPPFADVREEHYLPAFEAGMAEQRGQWEAIATDPAPADLVNTVEALERSGALLSRVARVFWNAVSAAGTDGIRGIQAEVAPRLAAHSDALHLDRRIFERVEAVHAARDTLTDPEQRRLVERYRTDFVRAGAALDDEDAERLRGLNAELSALTTQFQSKLLAEATDLAVHVVDEAQLDGLSADARSAGAAAAQARGLDGWLLSIALPTDQPVLAVLRDRSLRERVFRASTSRGGRGGENDTRSTLTAIAQLRAERAGLLGHETHADYVIADQTAGSREAAATMLAGLVGPTIDNVAAEAAELEARLLADGGTGPLQPWDWSYYSELVRSERFKVDQAALRPYLELHRVVQDGVLAAATALYGLTFTRRDDLTGWGDDVEVYEVFRPDGSGLGLVLADWYAREGKQGGAWMSSFVDQSHLLGDSPVVFLNLNAPRPGAGQPTLLTPDLVRTAFHEFGHVLHGLLSDVTYPRFSGTDVPRDFVEFPSQVNELWAWWPEVLRGYAVHHETGEPMPADLADALLAADGYGQGFATAEIVGAALLDLAWHSRPASAGAVAPEDVEAFEHAALAEHGLDLPLVPPRYRTTYFAHIFTGGYSAGYYSYLWSP